MDEDKQNVEGTIDEDERERLLNLVAREVLYLCSRLEALADIMGSGSPAFLEALDRRTQQKHRERQVAYEEDRRTKAEVIIR